MSKNNFLELKGCEDVWISIKDKLPNNGDKVVIKTDCKDCPLATALYVDKFIPYAIIQCDHHYETDQKFMWLKVADADEVESYTDRIIEWAYINHPSLKGRVFLPEKE